MGDGAGIARIQALVVVGIEPEGLARIQEALHFGDHAGELRLILGTRLGFRIGRIFHMIAHESDAPPDQGMSPEIRILPADHQHFLIFEHFEKLQQPPCRLAGAVQGGDRILIGGLFLAAAVFEERLLRYCGAAGDNRQGGVGRAGGEGRGAENEGHDGRRVGVTQHLVGSCEMAAGNVAGLMSDDADKLV